MVLICILEEETGNKQISEQIYNTLDGDKCSREK